MQKFRDLELPAPYHNQEAHVRSPLQRNFYQSARVRVPEQPILLPQSSCMETRIGAKVSCMSFTNYFLPYALNPTTFLYRALRECDVRNGYRFTRFRCLRIMRVHNPFALCQDRGLVFVGLGFRPYTPNPKPQGLDLERLGTIVGCFKSYAVATSRSLPATSFILVVGL